MNPRDVLKRLNLKELIGTPFEDLMVTKKFSRDEVFLFEESEKFCSYYLVEGRIQHIIYPENGKKFYRNFFKDDLVAVNFTLAEMSTINARPYDVDMTILKDSTIIYMPFEKVINMELKDKEIILKKVLAIVVDEHFREFYYLLNKSLYSDEEFFIKYLIENESKLNMSLREISERLNLSLRYLQKVVKNLIDQDIVTKKNNCIKIKNYESLKIYMNKFNK